MKKVALIIALFLFSGCATYRPIVDMNGVNSQNYENDLKECQAYAQQVSPAGEGAAGAVIGAAVGGAIGVVLGSFIGKAGEGLGQGAAIGAVAGGATGASGGVEGQIDIIRRCMSGRGYKILR